MPLVPCRACSARVSDVVTRCPHCGAYDPDCGLLPLGSISVPGPARPYPSIYPADAFPVLPPSPPSWLARHRWTVGFVMLCVMVVALSSPRREASAGQSPLRRSATGLGLTTNAPGTPSAAPARPIERDDAVNIETPGEEWAFLATRRTDVEAMLAAERSEGVEGLSTLMQSRRVIRVRNGAPGVVVDSDSGLTRVWIKETREDHTWPQRMGWVPSEQVTLATTEP